MRALWKRRRIRSVYCLVLLLFIPIVLHQLVTPPRLDLSAVVEERCYDTVTLSYSQFVQQHTCNLTFPSLGGIASPMLSIVMLPQANAEHIYRSFASIVRQIQSANMSAELLLWHDGTQESAYMLHRFHNITTAMTTAGTSRYKLANSAVNDHTSPSSKYILFIGSSVELIANQSLWYLVKLLEQDASIGAAGCKMLLPEGQQLFEACSIVFRDGSTLGYGSRQNPQLPQYNYVRWVHFCTSACLLVRRASFHQIGGFDESYPFSYGDADFQFRMRAELGLRIAYQPLAVATISDVTFNYDEREAVHAQAQSLFSDRWRHKLQLAADSSSSSILCARDTRSGLHILFVDWLVAEPAYGAGFGRAYEIFQAIISLGHSLTVYPLLDRRCVPFVKELGQMGIEVLCANNRKEQDAVKDYHEFLAGRGATTFDVIIVSRPPIFDRIAQLTRELAPNSFLIYDAEALWYVRDLQKARLEGDKKAEKLALEAKNKELALFSRANQAWLVSIVERDIVLQAGLIHSVHLITHALSLNAAVHYPSSVSEQSKSSLVGFLGAFHGSMYYNGDAVMWFVKNVYPGIRAGAPSTKLLIAGVEPPEPILRLHSASNRIEVLGRIEDLDAFLSSLRVFVVPHRYGAGVQIKLIETLARGVPAVVIADCAAAMGVANFSQGVLIANTALQMQEMVLALLYDTMLFKTLSNAAMTFSRSAFSRDTLRTAVANSLRDVPRITCHR